MLILTLLSIVCCCGCPAWFGKPMWEQYPANAALPVQVEDHKLQDNTRTQRDVEQLKRETGAAHGLVDDTFAGVYTSSSGKQVVIFGSTGFRISPSSDLDDEITRLTPQFKLEKPQEVETGTRGQYERCAVGNTNGTAVVLCTWADHGSVGSGLFTRLSLEDSARLLATFRDQIVTRG
jgi:hypothetical protein